MKIDENLIFLIINLIKSLISKVNRLDKHIRISYKSAQKEREVLSLFNSADNTHAHTHVNIPSKLENILKKNTSVIANTNISAKPNNTDTDHNAYTDSNGNTNNKTIIDLKFKNNNTLDIKSLVSCCGLI